MLLNTFLSLTKEERIKVLYSSVPYSIERLYQIAIENFNNKKGDWIMPEIHKEWLELLISNRRFETIFAPRGFAKSAMLKIAVIHLVLTREVRNCIYVSATATQSERQVAGIISVLEDLRLQTMMKYTILNSNKSVVTLQFEDGKTAQIQSVTAGGSLRGENFEGTRPEIVAVDDLEEDKTAYSIVLTDKLERWVHRTLIPVLPDIDSGRVRYIGTILSKNALGNRIKNNLPSPEGDNLYVDWNVQVYQALEKGKSVWESKFSTESLKSMKLKQPRMFASEYENAPLDESNSLITREMFNYYDNKHFDYSALKEVYCHFDLNVTKTEQSDYFAGLVLGRDKENKVYILDIIYTKPTIEEQADIIINTWLKWSVIANLKEITIDGVAYQRTLKTWVDKVARDKGVYINVRAVTYSKDKFNHFVSHEPLFTSRSVYIPNNHQNIHHFLNELLSFPSTEHDDLIDCFSFTADNMVNKPAVGFKRNTQTILTKL